MALVDYASDVSDEEHEGPLPKKPRTGPSSSSASDEPSKPTPAALPPLPASFHDLYASTVRASTADDPSLHQGRRRQNPHVVGHWPSHLYVEWHPAPAEHTLLEGLVKDLRAKLSAAAGPEENALTSFLLSDVGVPLPLHISLSRPIVLTTGDKDAFLTDVTASARRAGIEPFRLQCHGVEWHRTEESRRSFLVLRVRTTRGAGPVNPELRELLRRCNGAAKAHGQPELYQWATDGLGPAAPEGSDGLQASAEGGRDVGNAFHISIAWSFAEVTEQLKELTTEVFWNSKTRESLQEISVEVGSIKAKIGNVVTDIPLPQGGRRGSGQQPAGQLGLG